MKKEKECRYPIRIQAPPHGDDEIQPSPKQSIPMPRLVIPSINHSQPRTRLERKSQKVGKGVIVVDCQISS